MCAICMYVYVVYACALWVSVSVICIHVCMSYEQIIQFICVIFVWVCVCVCEARGFTGVTSLLLPLGPGD